MYILRQQSLSLSDIKNITNNIFTRIPPLSFGELLSDKKYTSKKLRCFMIKRYYQNTRKLIVNQTK